jgi:hypothetical protein
VGNLFGAPNQNQAPAQSQASPMQNQGIAPNNQLPMQEIAGESQQPSGERLSGESGLPSWSNVFTAQDIDAEGRRAAQVLGDPNAYGQTVARFTALNEIATKQRKELEQAALDAGIDAGDLPRFMVANAHLDPRNPSLWAQNGKRNFAQVNNNDKKIRRAFIPGIGSALFGVDRDQSLKNLTPALQDNKRRGMEQEDRQYLAGEHLSPTEIELSYHPQTPKLKKEISNFPKGLFPAEVSRKGAEGWKALTTAQARKSPFVSYEQAVERDPQAMQIMQDRLADFFLKNVDNDTSLLGIRHDLWQDKDYDWRQIGPAIRQAIDQGLKLNSDQMRELVDVETQPPMQSLPHIFGDLFNRLPAYIRGNK